MQFFLLSGKIIIIIIIIIIVIIIIVYLCINIIQSLDSKLNNIVYLYA